MQAGDLLIAHPRIPDARFRGTVLMLTTMEPHTVGFVLNKPTEYKLSNCADNIPFEHDEVLYWGGPVNNKTVWMLHSKDWMGDNTIEVNDHWALTSSHTMIEVLAAGLGPQHRKLFTGYSSWAPGQLGAEMLGRGPWKPEHSWLIAHNPGPEWVLGTDDTQVWERATQLSSSQAVDSWL